MLIFIVPYGANLVLGSFPLDGGVKFLANAYLGYRGRWACIMEGPTAASCVS